MKKRTFSVFLAIMLLVSTISVEIKNESQTDKLIKSMSIREKVEQMMLVSYRVWKENPETGANPDEEIPSVNVTELNDAIRADLMGHDYGGVLLFGENFVDAEQTLHLVSDIQNANLEDGGIPLLVTVDQEGGNVARISFGTSGIGNMALAATGDPSNEKEMAGVLAYNSSPMKEIPNESGAGSAYAPNLAAALVSCFGGVKATGTLPVSVPEMDGNYQITDKILYEGGK